MTLFELNTANTGTGIGNGDLARYIGPNVTTFNMTAASGWSDNDCRL